MTNLSTIPVKQLKRAIAIRERIEKLQNKLAEALGEAGEAPVSTNGGRKKMSAAGRARISAAQKASMGQTKGRTDLRCCCRRSVGRRKMSPAAPGQDRRRRPRPLGQGKGRQPQFSGRGLKHRSFVQQGFHRDVAPEMRAVKANFFHCAGHTRRPVRISNHWPRGGDA